MTSRRVSLAVMFAAAELLLLTATVCAPGVLFSAYWISYPMGGHTGLTRSSHHGIGGLVSTNEDYDNAEWGSMFMLMAAMVFGLAGLASSTMYVYKATARTGMELAAIFAFIQLVCYLTGVLSFALAHEWSLPAGATGMGRAYSSAIVMVVISFVASCTFLACRVLDANDTNISVTPLSKMEYRSDAVV